jgi:multicomponent Na+:H+ antiporter subunit D
MIMTSAAQEGHLAVWFVLLFASAGVVEHAGIKIPYFAFFGHDSGIRCREAPANMLVAMTLAAALCIGIGVFPSALYALLPYPVDYVPYTGSHVLSQLQLLVFAVLAVFMLMRTGIYPPEQRSINLDFDWFYRSLAVRLVRRLAHAHAAAGARLGRVAAGVQEAGLRWLAAASKPGGLFERSTMSGRTALWVLVLLTVYLIIYQR